MAYFIVSYDLIKRKDYPELWDEFKRLNGHKCLRSVYLMQANNSAAEVRDHLKKCIDDDQLIVVEFSKKPATYRTREGTAKWIDDRF